MQIRTRTRTRCSAAQSHEKGGSTGVREFGRVKDFAPRLQSSRSVDSWEDGANCDPPCGGIGERSF